jgi:Tol biopolymer transport system component
MSSEVATQKQITDPGTVMGTVGYMSPEQVRGHEANHCSDIFSFGSVLYEMLSGQRAFRRETLAETMTAILKEEPEELSETTARINPPLEKIVRRCLEKRPERRFHSAHDLAFALEALSSSTSSPRTENLLTAPLPSEKRSKRLPWFIAGLALILAGGAFAFSYFSKESGDSDGAISVRLPVAIPEGVVPNFDVETHSLALSLDGRQLAFVAYSEGQRGIWLRPLNTLDSQRLSGTEGGYSIFWSPDSRHLAFFADGKLKRVEVSSKSLQTVCSLPKGKDASGTWGKDGTILFSEEGSGEVFRVAASGGTASLLVPRTGDWTLRWLHFLPDGRRFLFYRYGEEEQKGGIFAGSLDSNETKQVAPMPFTRPQYVDTGYLLYPREGSLVAQPFDEKALRFTGEPSVVVDRLPYFDKTGWADFSASGNGVLAYMTDFPKTRLVWLDRGGRDIAQIGSPGDFATVRLSPDGQRAALTINDPRLFSGDVWIQDLVRNTRTLFVSGPADDTNPAWSPDGRRLAYFSCCEDSSTLHIKEPGDPGKGQLPLKDQSFVEVLDWSLDGKFVIYGFNGNLWVLPFSDNAKPYALMETQTNETDARFSPDVQWVAFVSEETGRPEVYVTRLDKPGEKWRISNEGGASPRWRRDGKELFYWTKDRRFMSVPITPGPKFEAGPPAQLFKADPASLDYDVALDGQRFLFITSAHGTQSLPFAVVVNWMSDLKR